MLLSNAWARVPQYIPFFPPLLFLFFSFSCPAAYVYMPHVRHARYGFKQRRKSQTDHVIAQCVSARMISPGWRGSAAVLSAVVNHTCARTPRPHLQCFIIPPFPPRAPPLGKLPRCPEVGARRRQPPGRHTAAVARPDRLLCPAAVAQSSSPAGRPPSPVADTLAHLVYTLAKVPSCARRVFPLPPWATTSPRELVRLRPSPRARARARLGPSPRLGRLPPRRPRRPALPSRHTSGQQPPGRASALPRTAAALWGGERYRPLPPIFLPLPRPCPR